jgi:hypothetical protein
MLEPKPSSVQRGAGRLQMSCANAKPDGFKCHVSEMQGWVALHDENCINGRSTQAPSAKGNHQIGNSIANRQAIGYLVSGL